MRDNWHSTTRVRAVHQDRAAMAHVVRVRLLDGRARGSRSGNTASSTVRPCIIIAYNVPNTNTDELPEIRKNIEQGFKETQKTVSGWINNLAKKLDSGEIDEYDKYGNLQYTGRTGPPQRQNFGPSQSDQMHGIRKSADQRRSADHNRYDADNRVIGDDFAKLEMRDNEGT
jgi:hypothetical protein